MPSSTTAIRSLYGELAIIERDLCGLGISMTQEIKIDEATG